MAFVKDYSEQIRGVSYKPEDVHDELDDDSIPLLRANNISDGVLNFDDLIYVSKSKVKDTQKLKAGDILICASSGSKNLVGKAAYVPDDLEMTFGAFCKVVRPKGIEASFFQHFFQSPSYRQRISDLAAGANINNIRNEHIDEMQFPLPDLPTQRRIADTLDKVSEGIAVCRQMLADFDTLIKARFIEMFGDMICNPNGWEKVLLGEACDVRDGTHDSPKYFSEGYPLVTSKNVTGGKIDFTDCSLICEEDYNKINQRSKVDVGDILMPMIGTVGNPVIVDIDAAFAIKNVALIKLRENSTVINLFVKALLESDYFDRAVISKVRGGTQKFISLGDIRKLEICLPPIDVQEQFAAFVKQIDKSKFIVQQLAELETLKKSLMQEYFG